MIEGVWSLHRRRGGELLASLVVTGGDFPWLHARVEPAGGLEDVRPLFVDELRLLERVDEDVEAWERAYDAVRNVVVLRYPDGRDVPEFLLHVDGDEAWWRWSDQAFDDD
ncbi:hypothetical protein [Catenuloplanes indicus]|nr:hypothetical protein [Catenuloplanes indicus]